MPFMQSPIPDNAVPGLVLPTSGEQGSVPWLLVDAALVEVELLRSVARACGCSPINAFEASPLVAFGDRAPHLVRLVPGDEAAGASICRLLAADRQAPCISLLWVNCETLGLLQVMAYLAQPRIDGDLDLHCRFADTRVLPHLLSVLSDPQRARIGRSVRCWRWFSRSASVLEQRFDLGRENSVEPDPNERLQLNGQQFADMLSQTEPDTLLTQLLQNNSDLVPSEPGASFHSELQRLLVRADALAIEQPPDRLQFAVLSLALGAGFHQRAELQSTWARIARGQTTLLKATQEEWSDDLWAALEAAKPIVELA
jgi:Domain of unknown function (DUF4123)